MRLRKGPVATNPKVASFNGQHAVEYGVEAAVLIAHLQAHLNIAPRFDLSSDGRTWCGVHVSVLERELPIWDSGRLVELITELVQAGVILANWSPHRSPHRATGVAEDYVTFAFVDEARF